MSLGVLILAFVTVQRLGELWLSARNTRRLLARGAREVGASHYPLIVALHAVWLIALWWLAPDHAPNWIWLTLFVVLQMLRFWVILSLGERWTTRIIVLPDAPLVRRGPYRLLKHPNYLVVVVEIAVLPLVFGLWAVAVVFSLLNVLILAIRIRTEDEALAKGAASS